MKEIAYPSLSHRIVAGWADTLPAFHPMCTRRGAAGESAAPNGQANPPLPTEESQRQFHAFLSQAAFGLRAHPEWLELPTLPDDGYDHFELLNRRPDLNTSMLKIKRKLNDFLYLLLQIGLWGEPATDGTTLFIAKEHLRLMEKTKTRLSQIGLTVKSEKEGMSIGSQAYPLMAPAWKWLAHDAVRTAPQNGKKNEPPLRFVHALFDEAHPYGQAFFRRYCAEEPGLTSLLDWLEQEGYQTSCNRDNRTNADWAKFYGRKPEPLKDAWAERAHGGFSIEYEWVKKQPVLYALRVPEYKRLLGHFSSMPSRVRELVVRHTKHCDNCGYCTQTDKTGTRPKSFVLVEQDGKHALCTMFPGFGYAWREMDEPLAAALKDFLTFIDRTMSQNRAEAK